MKSFDFGEVLNFAVRYSVWWREYRPIACPLNIWRPPPYTHGEPQTVPFVPLTKFPSGFGAALSPPLTMLDHVANGMCYSGCPLALRGLR